MTPAQLDADSKLTIVKSVFVAQKVEQSGDILEAVAYYGVFVKYKCVTGRSREPNNGA